MWKRRRAKKRKNLRYRENIKLIKRQRIFHLEGIDIYMHGVLIKIFSLLFILLHQIIHIYLDV